MNEWTAMIEGQRAMRETLLRDRQRPLWHFVSPEGNCVPFDPNGAIHWNGRYHLCYIFQHPCGHSWGHVSSHDLVHWRWHEPALIPAPGDADRGIFSGNCFVNRDGAATMLYHGVDAGNCVATCSDPNLDHWTKLSANPVVPNPKPDSPESKLYNSWDPHGWVEGDTYHAIFGGAPGGGVPPTLFKAKELDAWRFVGPFLAHDMPDVESFEDVSCPDFFPLGGKHVLVCISHALGARYYVGRWDGERFHPELHRRMNWPGGSCFAPETLLDAKGRRVLWTWAVETPLGNKRAWGGVMTLPRVLSLAPDDTLFVDPVEELQQLRLNPRSRRDVRIGSGTSVRLDEMRGESLELELKVRPGAGARFGLKLRRSSDGEEETVVWHDPAAGVLRVDVAKASLDPEVVYRRFISKAGDNPVVTAQEAPFALEAGEALQLRVFLDRSILEVFANRRQCLTQRVYPMRPDSLDLVLVSEGGDCEVEEVKAWDMASVNPW